MKILLGLVLPLIIVTACFRWAGLVSDKSPDKKRVLHAFLFMFILAFVMAGIAIFLLYTRY